MGQRMKISVRISVTDQSAYSEIAGVGLERSAVDLDSALSMVQELTDEANRVVDEQVEAERTKRAATAKNN